MRFFYLSWVGIKECTDMMHPVFSLKSISYDNSILQKLNLPCRVNCLTFSIQPSKGRNMSMKSFVQSLFVTLLTIAPAVLLAQPGLPDAPSQAPIDGGLSVVALAGGAYAAYKLRKEKK
jgi:hypothetical protein